MLDILNMVAGALGYLILLAGAIHVTCYLFERIIFAAQRRAARLYRMLYLAHRWADIERLMQQAAESEASGAVKLPSETKSLLTIWNRGQDCDTKQPH